MLKTIEAAISVKARKNAAIARDLEKSSQTVTAWFSGRCYIPRRVRIALCNAIGAEIDWPAYECDYAEAKAAREASRTTAPAPAIPATAPTAPPMPRAAPQISAATPKLTARPPTPPATQKATVAPAKALSSPSRSFLGSIFRDEQDIFA